MRDPLAVALLGNAQTPRIELADRGLDGVTNRFRCARRVELGAPLPGGVDRLLQLIHGQARSHRGQSAILPVRTALRRDDGP